jgi:hypothetical protein
MQQLDSVAPDMSILLVMPFLAASSWALFTLVCRLRRAQASRPRWLVFLGLMIVGLALGVWCAFYFEYRAGGHDRIRSFPLPVVFFHLEDGRWVDFPVPQFQAWAAIFTNILTMAAVVTLPVWLLTSRPRPGERATS